jgi:hypothetical protein
MLQKAAASAVPGLNGAALPALSSQVPDGQGPSGLAPVGPVPANQGSSSVRMTENAADQATPEGTQHNDADPVRLIPRSTTAATSSEAGSPDAEAVPAQELGCGEDCLNRLSFIHCDPKLCPCGASCSNRSQFLPWICICPLSWLQNTVAVAKLSSSCCGACENLLLWMEHCRSEMLGMRRHAVSAD